jgi:hypothetical protein
MDRTLNTSLLTGGPELRRIVIITEKSLHGWFVVKSLSEAPGKLRAPDVIDNEESLQFLKRIRAVFIETNFASPELVATIPQHGIENLVNTGISSV